MAWRATDWGTGGPLGCPYPVPRPLSVLTPTVASAASHHATRALAPLPLATYHRPAGEQGYSFYGEVETKTKFWGKAIECILAGHMAVKLKAWGEEYRWAWAGRGWRVAAETQSKGS